MWWKSCDPHILVNKAAESLFTSNMPTSGSIFLPWSLIMGLLTLHYKGMFLCSIPSGAGAFQPKTRYQVSFLQQHARKPTCKKLLSPSHCLICLTRGRSMEPEFINLTSCNIPHPTPLPLQESAWRLEPPPLGIQATWTAETYIELLLNLVFAQ